MNRKWLLILDITPYTLEYFNAAKKLGVNTIFITVPLEQFTFGENIWLKAQAAADEVIISPSDKLVTKIQEFLNQHPGDEIIGGVTPEEYRLIDLDKIHRFLGLSHLYQDKQNIISDKYLVRQELEKNGISKIKSFPTPSPENLDRWLTDFERYPCVMKPNHGSGSLFVKIARNVNDLHSAIEQSYSFIETQIYQTLLGEQVPFFIEDYILGDMFSFEGLMVNEHLYSWGIAKRFRYPHDETIEMGSTYPTYVCEEEKWRQQIETLLLALGWKNGGIHFEGIVTPTGDIEMIEFNPRVAGGNIPKLIEEAHNISVFEQVIRHIFLKEPVIAWPTRNSAGWATRRVGALKSGTLIDIPQIQDNVRAYWHVSRGDLVNIIQSNYGYLVDLVVKSDTVDQALNCIDKASEELFQKLEIVIQ